VTPAFTLYVTFWSNPYWPVCIGTDAKPDICFKK